MGKIFKAVFGGAPKAPKQLQMPQVAAPAEVAQEGTDKVADSKASAKAVRTQLLATEGGIMGEDLEEGQTKKRDKLLGN